MSTTNFVPSNQWQVAPPGLVFPSGGHYRMNLATGKNEVRWDDPVPGPETVIDRATLSGANGQNPPQTPASSPGGSGAAPPVGNVNFTLPSYAQAHGAGLSFSELVSGQTIQKVFLPLPPEIIGGILSRGEKGELAGGSKSFKTWALIQQALSITAGIDWWGFPTHPNNVIFLNLEIPQPFFEQRVRLVANELGIKIPECFNVWHLRGAKLGDPERWTQFLCALKNKCALIPNPYLTSDPIYKLLGGRNENAAGDVQTLLEQLDDMIGLVDGANFFGHHYSKGNQAAKEAIDRAAGSGVFQRDPDSILTMTSHEKEKCFTVESILRNHAPIDPFVVEWRYPLFVRENNLDPSALKQPGKQKKYDVMLFVKWLGTDQLATKAFQRRLKEETGMSEATFYRMLQEAEAQKLIVFDGQTNTWEKCGKP